MLEALPAVLLLGLTVGLLLGLLGGGGSILTVPALVYLIGQTPQVAVTTSLAIVGANSILGAYFHRTSGTLNWRVALLFGGAGMIVSYAAAGLSKLLSPALLMVSFAALMLFIGVLMLMRRQAPTAQETTISLPKLLLSGAGVGLLTGILGVGGGFLIVPALVMLVGLPIKQAIGTSLMVIAMNSFAGFMGHLGETINFTLIGALVITGLVGTFAGAKLGEHIPAARLRQVFAFFILALASFLLVDNLPDLLTTLG
jgi:uncharacterized membrane protein YfcA